MANNAKNIIVGAGTVYLGPTGEELTEASIAWSGSASLALNAAGAVNTFDNPNNVFTTDKASGKWTHVGYTSEGVTFDFSPDYGEVQVDQLLDVAKIFKQGQKVSVKTTFTEATLENFLITMGSDSNDLGTVASSGNNSLKTLTLNGGALGYSPIERSLLIVGPAPDSIKNTTTNSRSERLYIGYRAVSMETVSIGIKKNEATVFPVTFRLLPSSTNVGSTLTGAEATYGKVIDRVYTAS